MTSSERKSAIPPTNVNILRPIAMTLAVLFLSVGPVRAAYASPTSFQDYLFNVNGTSYCPDASCAGLLLPPDLDSSSFDFSTGIGTLVWTFAPGAAGAYFLDAFFDHSLDTPFFDEFGTPSGSSAAGVSWQIDEPGLGDGN